MLARGVDAIRFDDATVTGRTHQTIRLLSDRALIRSHLRLVDRARRRAHKARTENTMSTIINRTPHTITIMHADGQTVLLSLPAAPRGEVARVESTTETDGDIGGVPLMITRWGGVISLPDPQPDVYHIVSTIVVEAAIDAGRDCRDLLVPGDQVRDAQGRIVGCRGLTTAASCSPALAGQRGYKVAMEAHLLTDPEAMNCRPEPESPVIELGYLLSVYRSLAKSYDEAMARGGLSYRSGDKRGEVLCHVVGAVRRALEGVEFP